MPECGWCKHAEWDYETYYGTTQKFWFVCWCKKGNDCEDEQNCKDYEEEEAEEWDKEWRLKNGTETNRCR